MITGTRGAAQDETVQPTPAGSARLRPLPRLCLGLLVGALGTLTACGSATPTVDISLAAPATAPLAPPLSAERATSPALSVAADTLQVFHKHSVTVPATFGGLHGRVNLRLVSADGSRSGLQLETRSVLLGGKTDTRDLVISAPGLPDFYKPDASLSATYTLVASQGGKDLASTPVTIEERLLALQVSVSPADVSAHNGERVRFTVTVTLTPALDGPQPIELHGGCPTEGCGFRATPVSATTGSGSVMSREFELTIPQGITPPPDYAYPLHYSVEVGDFAGYRMPWYGDSRTTVIWHRLE